jgi:transcriptional regulator with XRE-family HTH domain
MEQLKRLRTERGLSQVKLAARADIDPSTVNQIERGAREANPVTVRKLASALDVSIAELLEEAPKADRRSPYEPSFNDVLADERRLEQRVRLLNSAAEMWEEFAAARLFDLERLSLEQLLTIDAVSLNIQLDHAKVVGAMKRALTAQQRVRLEEAERRCIEANREFIHEVENTLARQRPADLAEFRTKREELRRASEAASEASGA